MISFFDGFFGCFQVKIRTFRFLISIRLYEIPSKFALIEYVLECASDVGFCMKPPKTIGDSQKNDTFLLVHACAFCGVCMVFA